MDIQEQIERSRAFHEWAKEISPSLPFDDSQRNRLVVLLFEQCMEHHWASLKLLSIDCLGSAAALMRPAFEAYIRGMWFAHCATDESVNRFVRTSKIPKIGPLLNDLRNSSCNLNIDAEMHGKMWEWMNDYTHGGAWMVKIRYGSRSPTFDRSLNAALLATTRRWAALALVAMCRLNSEVDLGVQTSERFLTLVDDMPSAIA